MKRALGTCYYPEHWDETQWTHDAQRMAKLGLTWVRIGEFAWSKLEPQPGVLEFDWLDRAIDVLGSEGLSIVLGTPTATPPRWMLDRHPDMLAVDADGRKRGFGSRRHYCFSHVAYREEAVRIATLLAKRYGHNPYLGAWQIDNEYGCHDTVLSYSDAARAAFQDWLAQRYQSTDALNRAWGNVFWSMEYQRFEQIGLPNLTVTEPNPAHMLDFLRFSSDQVRAFNAAQVAAIQRHSNAPISHNYMGGVTEFDHFALGQDMAIATWDSYPLGFLQDRVDADAEEKRDYARQGHPDFQAFHHDLYRGVGGGRWWVMEQQPGPVNWAPVNTIPLPGMVRLWTWEAFAHGAEAVCYFRWRQAPFAQEQMHTGLLRVDDEPAAAFEEVAGVVAELQKWPDVYLSQAPVALVFDYQAAWSWTVQPQGEGCVYLSLVLDLYCALRRMGLSIDIVPSSARDFAGYRLILVPGLEIVPKGLPEAIAASGAVVCYGPRTGSKTENYAIPVPLPPALPGLSVRIHRVETLPADLPHAVTGGGQAIRWREEIESDATCLIADDTKCAVLVQDGRLYYLAAWPDAVLADRVVRLLCDAADLSYTPMPDGVRTRRSGKAQFLFNYRARPVDFAGETIPPAGVVVTAPI
ncbi:MAG: beta-galactosidase [Pseudomonadota bacterium]